MKNKIIYALTMILPLSIYLLIYSLLFSITPDLIIEDDINDLSVIEYKDDYFIHGDVETEFIGGYVVVYNGKIGAVIDNDDIIKVGRKYYSYTVDKEDGQLKLLDVTKIEEQEEKSNSVPIWFVITAISTAIVAMIIIGKFDALKKRPYQSVAVTLWTVTGFLWLISFIATNMLGVFLVASISWTILLFERAWLNGKITEEEKNKVTSDTLKALKEALGDNK